MVPPLPPDTTDPTPDTASTPVSPELLTWLVCPVTHWPLTQHENILQATSPSGEPGLSYPIDQGVPVMLVDQADAPGDMTVAAWVEHWHTTNSDR